MINKTKLFLFKIILKWITIFQSFIINFNLKFWLKEIDISYFASAYSLKKRKYFLNLYSVKFKHKALRMIRMIFA